MEDNENPTAEDSAQPEPKPPLVGAGRRIREAREKAGLTVAKLCADLRISPSILEALEAGEYNKLAGAPYVRATLSSIARHLRLDPKDVLKAYADEMGSQETTTVQVSPYKDDSGTHAKAHKQIFILILAVLLFILLLIMGKVNTSAPETEPETPPADTDTLLSIDPLLENDSLPAVPDSAGADSLTPPRDTASAQEAKEDAARETTVRVLALTDSVWLRVLPAGARESSRYLRRNKPVDFTHDDAITFITRQGGSVRVFLGDSSLVPTQRRFKVDGDQVAY